MKFVTAIFFFIYNGNEISYFMRNNYFIIFVSVSRDFPIQNIL